MSEKVTFTRTRRSIVQHVRDWCEANGHTFEIDSTGSYVIDGGEPMTPGEAADKYLPGGFAGNFGKP